MQNKLKTSKLKLDKAEEKRDKAKAKIPKRKQRPYEKELPKSNVVVSESKAKPSPKLDFADKKAKAKLDFTESKKKSPSKLVDKAKPQASALGKMATLQQNKLSDRLHNELDKSEDDNVGVKTANSSLKGAEYATRTVKSTYHHQKLKPYKDLEKAEKGVNKANINHSFQKKMVEHPTSNPISKWQQKRAFKKQYTNAYRAGGNQTSTAVKGVVQKGADATSKAIVSVVKNPKVLLAIVAITLLFVVIAGAFSSCSVMMQGGLNAVAGTSYASEDKDIIAVDNNYTALENDVQIEIDNIESDYPDYDEYRYNLDEIRHDPHELTAYLSALYQYYDPSEVQGELQKTLDLQYNLELEREVEIRYRTETRTDSEGNSYTVSVPYDYYILNATLTKNPIKEIAQAELNAEQLEIFNVLLQTRGNKPLLFGGGSTNTDSSTDLSGVEFIDGERVGNHAIVDIAKSQVGNVGGQPYWSWYGFESRVEWCATFVSWVLNQAGYSEPKFAACTSQGMPYFQSRGQWANGNYKDIAAGDLIFIDWDNSGNADHVGIVIGTDGSRVYTVEGNSGDACHIRDYSLNSPVIRGYGLMN